MKYTVEYVQRLVVKNVSKACNYPPQQLILAATYRTTQLPLFLVIRNWKHNNGWPRFFIQNRKVTKRSASSYLTPFIWKFALQFLSSNFVAIKDSLMILFSTLNELFLSTTLFVNNTHLSLSSSILSTILLLRVT